MSDLQKCPDCQRAVEITIHEGTGEKIIWNPGQIVPHNCAKPTKYWCYYCGDGQGMAIPIERPCVHRLPPTEKQIIKGSLDCF